MKKLSIRTYPVLNMHSAGCARHIEQVIVDLPTVESVNVNLTSSTVVIKYDVTRLSQGEIRAAVLSAGYDIILDDENQIDFIESQFLRKSKRLKKQVIGSWLFAILMLLIAVPSNTIPYANYIRMGLAFIAMVTFGRIFYYNTWRLARIKHFTLDALVAMSTTVAFLFSAFNTFYPKFWLGKGLQPEIYYEAIIVIIAMVLTGKLMTATSAGNSSLAIRNLMGLRPKFAHIISGEQEIQVPIKELRVGDKVVVYSGEKIPIDGVVIEGSSYVDVSMITGEPIPVEKEIGSHVNAGTINQHRKLIIEAQQVGDETLLAQIIHNVQEVQAKKTPATKIVDRVSAFFMPFSIIVAILALVLWCTLSGRDYNLWHGIYAAISVLILACPCAIGFAAPIALIIGVMKARNNDVLVKEAKALEQLKFIDTIVLDKTGTITEGSNTVIGWLWAVPQTEEFKQVMLAAVERADHPLSNSIAEDLSINQNILPIQLDSFKSKIGGGIEVLYKNEQFWMGGRRLMREYGIEVKGPLVEMIGQYEEKGNSIIYFGKEDHLIAIVAVADQVKPTSFTAIKELRRLGLNVVMLTGDSERTAKSVARSLEISSYRAEMLPMEKEDFVRDLQRKGHKVAMVGDGINDSQALACADVSIAMGKGTDIAMNVAMVTLMTSDLLLLPTVIRISKYTVRNIYQNLFWAFLFNILALPIVIGAFEYSSYNMLSPLLLNVVMILSTLAVVINSIFLDNRKFK